MNLKMFIQKRDGLYFGKHRKIKSSLTKRIIAGTLSAFMVLSGNIPTSHALPVPNNVAEAGEVESNNPVVHVGELMEIGLGENAQNHAIKFRKQKGNGSYDQYLAYNGYSSVLYTASAGATLKDHYRPADKINETPITPLVYSPEEKAKYGEPTEWRKITQAEYNAMTQNEKTDIDQQYEAYKKAFYKYGGNWKQPGITLEGNSTSDYKFQNFNPTSESGVEKSLFENGKYKSYKNEEKGYVIQRGQVKGNDKLYAEFIEEATYAQQPTDDGYLTEQPSGVNLITKITNIDEQKAQAFTQYWAVDTQIGRDDQAAFRGEGTNRFFSGRRTVNNYPGVGSLVNQGMVTAFPISETIKVNGSATQANDPWFKRAISNDIKMFTNNSYDKDKMPGFLYAIEEYSCGGSSSIDYSQKISNPMTVQIVPTARSSVKWPDAKIEKADYLVLGYFGSVKGNYAFHATGNGSGGEGVDSGHGVRVNPTLIMPEETKYFGVSYGRSTSDDVNPNGISLSYNGYTQEVTKSNNKYNILDDVKGKNMGGDLLLYNRSGKTFNHVKIRMLLPKGYLVANSTMSPDTGKKWTKLPDTENKTMFSQTADFDVWEYDYGTLTPGTDPNSDEFNGISIQPPVEITAIPRSKKDAGAFQEYPRGGATKEGVIPAYGFYVVYDGSAALSGTDKTTFEKYTVRNRLVKLPYLDPMNLEGTVWRDLSGDNTYQASEGISDIKAKVSPKKDGTPGADETLSDRGPFKFENGYAKNRDKEYTLSFDAPNPQLLKNFIYRFDKDYNPGEGFMQVKPGVYVGENGTAITNLFDKIGLGLEADGDGKGNAKLTFQVKDVSEVPTVSFRLREFLAGKINIIPFWDADGDGQQAPTGESFVKDGKYKLTETPHVSEDYTAEPKDHEGFGTLTNIPTGNENTFKVIAARDYKITYKTPFGYRTADGKSEVVKEKQTLASLLSVASGVDVPIALQAKDVRFAINTANANGYSDLAVEPNANDGVGGTTVKKESDERNETEYDLIFNAWDGTDASGKSKLIPKEDLEAGKLKREADFSWKILSDTGVLVSKYNDNGASPKISKKGQVTLKPNVEGRFVAEVTWNGTQISDKVTVNVVKKAEDITLGPNESVTEFNITGHPVTVKKDDFKGPFTIEAKIKNSATNAERTELVSPTQFQVFKGENDKFEVIPTPGQKSFKIKAGNTTGEYRYKVIYKGQLVNSTTANPSINDAVVKIVEEDYDPTQWKLEIIPSTVRLETNTNGTVQYKFTNLLDDTKSIADATNSGIANATFDATITNTTLATFGATKKDINAQNTIGSTPLKAEFTPIAGGHKFEAEGTVQVFDRAAIPVGKLGFEEVTTPTKTDGVLNVGEKAKYKVYIDGNENGQKDPGETYLKYDDIVWNVGANVTQNKALPARSTQEAVEVTGVTEGTDALNATYTDPVTSKRFEGVQPLEVIDLDSVKLAPETSIIVKGDTKREFKVSAVSTGGAKRVIQRPQYKVNIVSDTIAKEVGNKTTGEQINLKGLEVGVAKVTATMRSKTSNEGKVLVIPADLKLKLKDQPLWVEYGHDKTPEVEFTGTGLTSALETELKNLVKVEKVDSTSNIIRIDSDKKVTGISIGTTKIKASLPGVPGVEDTADVFVYDDNASLKVENQIFSTGEIKDVKVELYDGTNYTLVPAKYVDLKFDNEAIAKAATATTANSDGTFKVTTDKVSVKGVHASGQATTNLTAKIPGTTVTASGKMTVNGVPFKGPLRVVPNPVVLTGDPSTADAPISIVDANGREVPANMVTVTVNDPNNNNTIVGPDGKIHVKKTPGGNDVPNTFNVKLNSDPSVCVNNVPIINMPSGGSSGALELLVPDFRVAETQLTDPLTFANIEVKNGSVRKPLSDYTTDKTKVIIQANVLTLDGQVSIEEPAPPAATNIKQFKGVTKGAAAYRVTVTLPDGTVLTADGKIGVVPTNVAPQDLKAKLVAVKTVGVGGVGTQEIIPGPSPANKVRKTVPTHVQLQLYDVNDPTNILQTVADGALPYFVKDLQEDVAAPHFQVTETGELVNKTATGEEVQVKGTWVDVLNPAATPNAIENTQDFEIIDPGNGPLQVEPNPVTVPVGGTKNLDIKYPNGDPVPPTEMTITPDNPTIADNPNGTDIQGQTPGRTFVTVTVAGYPSVRVPVTVYDPLNGAIGITPDSTNPTGDPNDDANYPGGFIARDVIRIPVGKTIKYNMDIDGAQVPVTDFTVTGTVHSSIDEAVDPPTITGVSVGVDEVTFELMANPANKKIVKVIVYDPNLPQIGITLDDKPVVYRQATMNDRPMSAQLTKLPDDNATVMWVLEDTNVASFNHTTTYTEAAPSTDMTRTATVDWETTQPITTKLTAIVLESGKSDSITLCGLQATVVSIDIQPNPVQAVKNVPQAIDNMGPFTINITDDLGNTYPGRISDFDVIGSTGPITLSGADNRIVEATDKGPKTLKLRHRTSGKEVILQVTIPEDNTAVLTLDPDGGTINGNTGVQVLPPVPTGNPTTLPTPVKPGYTFNGWFNASGQKYDNTTPITGDETLTARWTQNSSGGSGGSTPSKPTTPTTPSKPTTPTVPTTPSNPTASGSEGKHVELNKDAKFAYITGYPDNTVKANAPISRAEVAAIFARLMKNSITLDQKYTSAFPDVKSGVWYTNYIGFLEGFKILTGYPDETFKPNNKITRAEFAVIISKFAAVENSKEGNFKDVPANHWAKGYVDNAVSHGWMGGYPDGTFKPNQPITRAEVVTVVNKMIERVPDKAKLAAGAKRYKDLKQSFWAYDDVIEASTDHTADAK